ncbi:Uncharacterized protein FWK35_00034342 [Aphis craccivora]|uniref:Uncharacterized protein n=1 Tax=Aphis craccivora TaxID=307492 RepID=A0A6G0ZGP1_APHCR|nr:Uncharacterized protein FWK35_00034342 [Aphis craccivora]
MQQSVPDSGKCTWIHFFNDFDKEILIDEVLQFQDFIMPLINNKTMDDPQHLLKYLRLINIKPAFPNIENVLQIYLTTPYD